MKLPRSLDALSGLRAARWIRESTRGQFDAFGPDAQREQQDRALERYGLVDTGIVWHVAHSGRTVGTTKQFTDMLAGAGVDYDVLLVGYTSRFTRHLKQTLVAIEDHLHPAGTVVLFCDERVLSSDEDRWDDWTREAHEAESYSRKLAKRIREGYDARWRRLGEQAGTAPYGFTRQGPRHQLQPDPETLRTVTRLFEVYATGTQSFEALAEQFGLAPNAIRETLRNPVYNGWVRRKRRAADEQRQPAQWRSDPPVSDELWARAQEVRAQRYRGGGGRPVRIHLLAKRVWCVCGQALRVDAKVLPTKAYRRIRHDDPCDAWSTQTRVAETFETSITDQLSRLRLTPAALVRVRAVVSQKAPSAAPLRRRQLERLLSEKATLHAKRLIATDVYLDEHRRLNAELDGLSEEPGPVIDADRAIAWLRHLRLAWRKADDETRQGLIRAVYQRITVDGKKVVSVELTPEAYRYGLDQTLPEWVALARPAGDRHGRATHRVEIIGRRERSRFARSA